MEDSETELILNKGFVITADSEIYVSYRFVSQSYNQAGAIVSKGISALGTSFRAGMLQNYSSSHLGFISVMATENNTKIDFDLPGSVQTTGGQNDHSITLEKFQSYFFINRDTQNSLIGTLISSNKPIAVNTGGFGSFDSSSGGQDYGMDQIVGSTLIGSEYIFIKGIASDAIETVLIIADKDNTDLYLNDGSTVYKTLNTGEYVFIKGGDFIDGNLYVYSDDPNKKLFAYQGTGKTYTSPYEGANQGMYFVPALNCATKGDVDNIASINEIGARDFNDQAIVSFITKNGANILVNGSDVTGPPYNATPTTVVGNSDYVTYKVQNLTGNIKVEADDELYVAYVNTNAAATTAGFYSGFTVPPNVDLDADLKTLGSCLNKNGTSNVIFEASNFTQFDSIEWMKYDTSTGDFIAIPGETGKFFTPSVIGNYVLKGILACNGAEYFSPEISVGICPDDFDKDGIIDNIDLDIDNDGILNSNESDGEVIFDFSDYENPVLSASKSLSATATMPGLSTGTTGKSITGLTDGDFETEMPVTTLDEFSYKLEFSENLNIKFTSQSITHSIVDGEYFEIKTDGDKNITLRDPENHLLVRQSGKIDFIELENVGGEKTYSANSITFKFNSAVSSLPKFEFIGYNLAEFQFTHHADDISSASIFSGNIKGIDLAVNTDKNHPTNPDTIPDYFDLDSDGDDCYDVTEAGFDDGTLIDGILGNVVPTYDDSQVDSRGRIIDPVHNYDTPLPLKDAVSGEYYFQQVGQAVSITDQPTNKSACIGEPAKFEVVGSHPTGDISYQWQFLDSATGIWNDLNGTNPKVTGWDSDTLEVSDVDASLAGEYRVQLKTDEYQCTTDSDLGISLVVNTPPATPIVEPIQTFCFTDNPTVGELIIDPDPLVNPPGLDTLVYDDYDPSDPAVGTLLDQNDPLVDGQYYYIQVTDASNCSSSGRTQTKVLLSNPNITPSVPESCPGDLITLTASNVPQTALDFELANITTLTKLPRTWEDADEVTSYYFYENVKRSWEDSFDRIAIYGVGASMYQINDSDEHNTVWGAIEDAGIDGSEPFWLGLKQDGIKTNDFDSGWRWLDGTKLPPGSTLWDLANNEPNDYDFTRPAGCTTATPDCDGIEDGSEDYGHFNLGGNGKLLNDYPNNSGSGSYSLYEFSGTTKVKWYYQLADDPANPGNRGIKKPILDGSGDPVNLTEITRNPNVTTFYILEVNTNGVICEVEYEHVVNPLPVPTAVDNIELCDEIDLTDPTSTNTDGISYEFYLDSQTDLIVDRQVDRNGNPLTVTYHETLTDAQDITKTGLSSPYANVLNPLGNLYDPQTIYVRLTDEATGCFDASLTFDIIVNTTPESNVVAVPPVVCDDTGPVNDVDGSSKFDLTLFNDEILGATQVAAGGFEVTYYYKDSSGTKVLIADPTAHYNTPDSAFDRDDPTVQTEEIFVRVTDTNSSTSCYREDTSFILTVNPLPVILNSVWKVEQCDDPLFDLTDYEEKVSTYPSTETFAYSYIDASGTKVTISTADAQNYISSSINYNSANPEIIDVEITKNTGGCSRTAQIELKVSYSQVPPNFAQTFIDDPVNQDDLFKTDGQTITDTDLSGQSQDGKEEFSNVIFDNIITELKAQVRNAFDIPGIEFEFYGSQRDATLRNNEIDITKSIYINETETPDTASGTLTSNYNIVTNRWEQEIWIYIENTNLSIIQSSCIGLEHVTTLYVEKRPVVYDVLDTTGTQPNDVLLLCDEQLTLDKYSEFDTSTLENLLIGNNSDPTTLPYQDTSNYIFEYSYDDDSGNPVTTATLDPKINLTNQPITLTLTNPDGKFGPLESSSSVDFMVFETPTPFSGVVLEDCDDFASPGGEYDEKTIFTINLDDFKENLFKDPAVTSSLPVQEFNNFEYVFTLYDKTDTVISTGLPADELPPTITAETGDYIIVDLTNPVSAGYGLICENQVRVDFIVNPRPSFDIDQETVVCLNPLPDNPIEIGTYNWGGPTSLASDYDYSWTRTDLNGVDDTSFSELTETIKIDKGGVYTVSVSDPRFSSFDNGCPIVKTITVTESEIASIDLDKDGDVLDSEYDHFIEVIDLTNDNTNTIKINNISDLGIGDYEFSLDNFNYTLDPNSSPDFTKKEPGVYSLYIRDKNSYYTYDYGCGILEITVSVIGYKKYFTPNNDGVNETWKILGIRSDFNADSKVYIFDRYGKLLKQLDPLSEGWDGTYLGKPMPATDYWFRVYLSEDGREFKGNFSLIRGN
ncbi:T9SS type B sorting domain-containing protein [Flavobacteriaceae bacterium]|nr:T9SS type B sorting domain-containing protein [Flavobacteriaceae bacterium]